MDVEQMSGLRRMWCSIGWNGIHVDVSISLGRKVQSWRKKKCPATGARGSKISQV